MTGPEATGRLRIVAATTRGATVLTDVYRTAPFHPGPLHDREGRAEVIVQDVSPGILPGDRLAIDVTVVEGASLSVVGQSATKLYPSPSGLPAELRTSLTVGAGGALWWLPGALIPFRDAVYTSRTHVTLHEGSRFALLEIITPGRMAMGECHAYASLDLRLRIDVAGKPVMIERTMLDPIARPPAFAADRQDLRCSGALVLIGYPVPREIENCRADVWLGADGGPNLAIVRGVSYSAEPLRNALESVLRGLQDRGD